MEDSARVYFILSFLPERIINKLTFLSLQAQA